MKQWLSRTYELATVESAVLYVAVVAALSISGDGWPTVELRRTRVRVQADSLEPGTRVSPLPAWSGWAQRLGGSEVLDESEPKTPDPTREEKP